MSCSGKNRCRVNILKGFSKHELQALFVALTCAITLFVLCTELRFNRSIQLSNIATRKYSQSRTDKSLMKYWMLSKNMRFRAPKKSETIKQKKNSEFPEEYSEFLHSARNISHNIFFFNSSDMFGKLFKTWLQSHSGKTAPEVTFTINHINACNDSSQDLALILAVTSSASHLESRAAIRETWGGYARERGAKLIFFTGLPKNVKYLARIASENSKFQDIIQGNFLDTYFNLSIKTISVLKWVKDFCPKTKFVLKADDDMFINVERFLNVTCEANVSKSILGELAHEWSPVRSPKNKWFASLSDYPFNIYPDFVFGPSYLLTGDSVKLLYDSTHNVRFFHLEDVYLTGFVAEMANISRINLPFMFNIPKDLQPCSFRKLLSSHGHTPSDIRRHWMWLNRRNFKCISES